MVGTVGVLEARPNMINVVPGEADLLVDFRGIDPDAIAETLGRFEAGAAEIAARRGVTIDWTSLMRDAPLAVSLEMVEAAEAAARAVEVPCRRLTSGASHDARAQPCAHCSAAGAEHGLISERSSPGRASLAAASSPSRRAQRKAPAAHCTALRTSAR